MSFSLPLMKTVRKKIPGLSRCARVCVNCKRPPPAGQNDGNNVCARVFRFSLTFVEMRVSRPILRDDDATSHFGRSQAQKNSHKSCCRCLWCGRVFTQRARAHKCVTMADKTR